MFMYYVHLFDFLSFRSFFLFTCFIDDLSVISWFEDQKDEIRLVALLYMPFHLAALLWHMPKVLSWPACWRYLPNSRMWVWFCTRWSMWKMWEAFESNWVENSQVQGTTLPFRLLITIWFHLTLYSLSFASLVMPISFVEIC